MDLPVYNLRGGLFSDDYTGVSVSAQGLPAFERPHEHFPVYVGPDGTLFDLHYNPIGDDDQPSNPALAPPEDRSRITQLHAHSITREHIRIRPFPVPEDYETFFDFEQAVLDWKTSVQAQLGFLHLPFFIGRCVDRPLYSGKEEGFARSSTADSVDSEGREKVMQDGFDKLADSTRLVDDEERDEDCDVYKSVAWSSRMMPPKPSPLFFPSLEEYERATVRWAEECSRYYMPPHPYQLEEIAHISSVKPPPSHRQVSTETRGHSTSVGSSDQRNARSTVMRLRFIRAMRQIMTNNMEGAGFAVQGDAITAIQTQTQTHTSPVPCALRSASGLMNLAAPPTPSASDTPDSRLAERQMPQGSSAIGLNGLIHVPGRSFSVRSVRRRRSTVRVMERINLLRDRIRDRKQRSDSSSSVEGMASQSASSSLPEGLPSSPRSRTMDSIESRQRISSLSSDPAVLEVSPAARETLRVAVNEVLGRMQQSLETTGRNARKPTPNEMPEAVDEVAGVPQDDFEYALISAEHGFSPSTDSAHDAPTVQSPVSSPSRASPLSHSPLVSSRPSSLQLISESHSSLRSNTAGTMASPRGAAAAAGSGAGAGPMSPHSQGPSLMKTESSLGLSDASTFGSPTYFDYFSDFGGDKHNGRMGLLNASCRMEWRRRNDYLKSWHSRNASRQCQQAAADALATLIAETRSTEPLSYEAGLRLLHLSLPVDTFVEWAASEMQVKSFVRLVHAFLDEDNPLQRANIPLDLLNAQSPLFRAKFSYVVDAMLWVHPPVLKDFFKNILEAHGPYQSSGVLDLRRVWCLARCVCAAGDSSVDVFPLQAPWSEFGPTPMDLLDRYFRPRRIDWTAVLSGQDDSCAGSEGVAANSSSPDPRRIVHLVLLHSYVLAMVSSLSERKSNGRYKAAIGFLSELEKRVHDDVASWLKENPGFLASELDVDFDDYVSPTDLGLATIFRGLGHASPDVSCIFLFVIVHLMKITDTKDETDSLDLRSPSVCFMLNLCRIGATKYPHVEYAVERIWKVMSARTNWVQYVCTVLEGMGPNPSQPGFLERILTAAPLDHRQLPSPLSFALVRRYSEDIDVPPESPGPGAGRAFGSGHDKSALSLNVLERRVAPHDPIPVNARALINFIRSLLNPSTQEIRTTDQRSEMVLQMRGYKLVAHVLKIRLFNKFLKRLASESPKHQGHLAMVRFLSELCGFINRDRDIIQIKEDVTSKKKNNITLEVSVQEITTLSALLVKAPDTAFDYKRSIIVCIRHLLKPAGMYDLMRKEQRFYDVLVNLCEDHRHAELNREVWRLFYQLTSFHPKQLEYLHTKLFRLDKFFDMLGTNRSPVALSNILHYLTKLLILPDGNNGLELLATVTGRHYTGPKKDRPSRENPKHWEKLRVFLADYVRKSLLVKCHIVYKRFMSMKEHTKSGLPVQPCKKYGSVFQRLAFLYRVIRVAPACGKLCKDLSKCPEYASGIDYLNLMFGMGRPRTSSGLNRASSPHANCGSPSIGPVLSPVVPTALSEMSSLSASLNLKQVAEEKLRKRKENLKKLFSR